MLAESLDRYQDIEVDRDYGILKPFTIFGRKPIVRPRPMPNPYEKPGAPQTVTDYYTPQSDFGSALDRIKTIPQVLGLGLTDKDANTYQPKPLVRESTPLNATLFRAPETENFESYIIGAPLARSFAGQPSVLSGEDNSEYYNGVNTTPQDTSNYEAEQDSTPTEQTAEGCSWYDFPCKFQSVKGEATILIVGVVILAIGIYALVRG